MRKITKIMAMSALLASIPLCGIMMTSCGGSPKLSAKTAFEKVEDMYAFAAISSTSFFAAANTQAPQTFADETNESDVALELSQYLKLADGFIGGNKFPTTAETESDREGYTKLSIDLSGISGAHKYVIYYKETVPTDNDRPATDDDDYEIDTKIEGVMIYNAQEYTLTGTKEVEHDEVEIEFTVQFSDTDKVVISQESESDELEYSYALFQNGALIPSKTMDLEIEIENNEIEFELILTEGQKRTTYKIEDDKGSLKAIATVDGKTTTYTIKVVEKDGVKQYEFTDAQGNVTYYSLSDVVA